MERAYTGAGFGGYVPPLPAKPESETAAKNPLSALRDLCQAGNWTQVEAQAEALWQKQQFSADSGERKQAAQALLLAGELPDKGAPPMRSGETQAMLEEGAAFQHGLHKTSVVGTQMPALNFASPRRLHFPDGEKFKSEIPGNVLLRPAKESLYFSATSRIRPCQTRQKSAL